MNHHIPRPIANSDADDAEGVVRRRDDRVDGLAHAVDLPVGDDDEDVVLRVNIGRRGLLRGCCAQGLTCRVALTTSTALLMTGAKLVGPGGGWVGDGWS